MHLDPELEADFIAWQNGSDKYKDAANSKLEQKRQFIEIKSQLDLGQQCFYRKACAIALLNPIPEIDYEHAAHLERIQMLAELDRSADSALTPIHYSWIDVSCHVSFSLLIFCSLRPCLGSV